MFLATTMREDTRFGMRLPQVHRLLRRLSPTVIIVGAALAHAEPRTWTDVQGRTLVAELLEKRGDDVVLRRDDGLVFNLAVDRLVNSDREYVAQWKPPQLKVPSVEESVLLINTPDGRGSGFLAQDNGRVFAYTNQHVIAGATLDNIRIVTTAGKVITPDAIEVIATADLARLRIAADAGLLIGAPARLEDKIAVYGNSQGAGVTTLSRGRVLGVAADQLEISSEIVPGNSGGPVLNEAGEVVGISTYLALSEPGQTREDPRAWTIKNTRYEKPRRFALRIMRGMDWKEQVPAAYVAQSRKVLEFENLVQESWALAERLVAEPTQGVPTGLATDPRLREVVSQQNELERRLSRSSLSSFNTVDDVERFNVSLNQSYRRRLVLIGDILERAIADGRRNPPKLELPYHQENYDRAAGQAARLVEELGRVKDRSVPFMQLR